MLYFLSNERSPHTRLKDAGGGENTPRPRLKDIDPPPSHLLSRMDLSRGGSAPREATKFPPPPTPTESEEEEGYKPLAVDTLGKFKITSVGCDDFVSIMSLFSEEDVQNYGITGSMFVKDEGSNDIGCIFVDTTDNYRLVICIGRGERENDSNFIFTMDLHDGDVDIRKEDDFNAAFKQVKFPDAGVFYLKYRWVQKNIDPVNVHWSLGARVVSIAKNIETLLSQLLIFIVVFISHVSTARDESFLAWRR